ncbi:MAG: hybrid sensor histidine kinase/response regulator [Kofleriaceae bacterium]
MVEDNDGDAELIRESLTGRYNRVVFDRVERVETALQRISETPVDVVLLDLTLPDSSGLAGLVRLRAAAPAVALVVLTGTTDDQLGQRALLLGAQDFLQKGEVDGASLDRALRHARTRQDYLDRTRQLAEESAGRVIAEAAHRRSQWLADAGKRLSASVDEAATLASFYSVVVPDFCEKCSLHLDPSGGNTNVVLLDPGLLDAYRSGKTIDDASLSIGASVSVPLTVAGRVFGAVKFEWSTPQDHLVVLLAEDLALRVAMAIDNARLYGAAQAAILVRDDFLSIASHELRTPLATLEMLAHLMEQELCAGTVSNAQLSERVRRIGTQTHRMGQMIGVLLDASMITSGQLNMFPEPLDLVAVIRGTLETFKTAADAARCDLALEGDDRIDGEWDRLRMEQVFANLITNALKYGPGQPVRVVVERSGADVTVSVTDGGRGIRSEDHERVFDRFQRGAGTGKIPGLGLGLYVTRQIVVAHGGSIAVLASSTTGTSFGLRLPLTVKASA